MRGIAKYNFPAFDAAVKRISNAGHEPISPADLDRAEGFDENTSPLPASFVSHAIRRDLLAIIDSADAIALLRGWDKSAGVAVEIALARLLKMPILDARTLKPADETILDEAKRLTRGSRLKDYGHPYDDFLVTADLWSTILEAPVEPHQIALCMIAVKIAREMHQAKRDNAVDIAGYADALDRVRERERGLTDLPNNITGKP